MWSRVTSELEGVARYHLAPEAGPFDSPEERQLARVAGVQQHGEAPELRQRLHHEHARKRGTPREVAGKERLGARELPATLCRLTGLDRGHRRHEEKRRPVRQDVDRLWDLHHLEVKASARSACGPGRLLRRAPPLLHRGLGKRELRHAPGRVQAREHEGPHRALGQHLARLRRGWVAHGAERDVAMQASPIGQRHVHHGPVRGEGDDLALDGGPHGIRGDERDERQWCVHRRRRRGGAPAGSGLLRHHEIGGFLRRRSPGRRRLELRRRLLGRRLLRRRLLRRGLLRRRLLRRGLLRALRLGCRRLLRGRLFLGRRSLLPRRRLGRLHLARRVDRLLHRLADGARQVGIDRGRSPCTARGRGRLTRGDRPGRLDDGGGLLGRVLGRLLRRPG